MQVRTELAREQQRAHHAEQLLVCIWFDCTSDDCNGIQVEALDGAPAEAAVDIVTGTVLPSYWTDWWLLTGQRVVQPGLQGWWDQGRT